MQIAPINDTLNSGSRFERDSDRAGTRRGPELEGSARPGDVLALAGGTIVRDVNENGLVDGYDAVVEGNLGALAPRSGRPVTPDRLGSVIDVLG